MAIKVSTANARMSSIIKEFGVNSAAYQMAADYIERVIDEKFIKRNKNGDITGLRQIAKETHLEEWTDEDGKHHQKKVVDKEGLNLENAFGRSDIFDTYLPTITSIYKTVMQNEGIDGNIKDNKKVLKPLIEAYATEMNSYETTVDDIYDVRDDVEHLHDTTLIGRAQDLIDERERTLAWIQAAKELVAEYDKAAQIARQNRH